jgi:HAD superfamily hydrolase (TIGR01509 family)
MRRTKSPSAQALRAFAPTRRALQILLDIYGVLLNRKKMLREYRTRMADLLANRFGGNRETWLRAHDEAYARYTRSADDTDWTARGYGDIVDELDAAFLLEMLERAGLSEKPPEPLALFRDLERRVLMGVNVRFPDARTAIERLRKMGHRIHVATGGSVTNDAALQGAGLSDLIDEIFTGHSQDRHKAKPEYWATIPAHLGAKPSECVLVDDRLDYLAAAASVGIVALLLDRKGAHRPEAMPSYVQATLRNLAGLPHWVETWTAAHPS